MCTRSGGRASECRHSAAITDAIDDMSDALRGLREEAARRPQEGRADDALRYSFRYGVHIVAFIENEKPKEKGRLTRSPLCRHRARPSPRTPECIGIGQCAC